MEPRLAFVCTWEGACSKRPRSSEKRLAEHYRTHLPRKASRREIGAAGRAARLKFEESVGPEVDGKALSRRVVWPSIEDGVRKEFESRKRGGGEEGAGPAKVARADASATPVTDEGWEVWLKVGERADNLSRQAQNQVLAGMARIKTSVALNLTNVGSTFEVDRRADNWGRWATSRGLEIVRTHYNQTRDELDHAARRIMGYQKQLGGVGRPQVPSRVLVRVADLDRAKQDSEALQASRATTLGLDRELQGAKAQVVSLEAQLKACRAQLRAERENKASSRRVTSAAGSADLEVVTSQEAVAGPSTPHLTMAVTPTLDTPTMAGVFSGVDLDSEQAMVMSSTAAKDVVAARLAVLQVWRSLGEFHRQ
jgi:hypothetical protein